MTPTRYLKNLTKILFLALVFVGCQSDTQQKSSPDSSSVKRTTVKLDVGPAGITMQPLLSATSGRTETLFESLSSDSTGIDFVNPIDQSHPQKYLFASAVACGGVAIGGHLFYQRTKKESTLPSNLCDEV